jgi:hypothetical protein
MSTLDKALQALLKMASKKLLWENAAPNSVFVGQTINLNFNGYNSVIVESIEQVGGEDIRENTVFKICRVGGQTAYVGIGVFSTGKRTTAIERAFKVNSAGINFNNAYHRIVDTTDGITGNDSYVPVKIFGINI